MKPVISIIIPAYNEEKYIKDTLLSLRNQDFDLPYEIIVCDNNSTDKTVNIAKKYADKVAFEKKQGGGYARNKGASVAKGKYFIFTDADTIFLKNYLKEAYKIFLQDKYAGFSGNVEYRSTGLWTIFITKLFVFSVASLLRLASPMKILTDHVHLPGFSICVSKENFEKCGRFDGSVKLEDVQLSKALSKIGKLRYFTHFKVITSSRRFEREGALRTVIGYINVWRNIEKNWEPKNEIGNINIK